MLDSEELHDILEDIAEYQQRHNIIVSEEEAIAVADEAVAAVRQRLHEDRRV